MNSFRVFNRALTYSRLSRPIVNNVIQKRNSSFFITYEGIQGVSYGIAIGVGLSALTVFSIDYYHGKIIKKWKNEQLISNCRDGNYNLAKWFIENGADSNNKEAMEAAQQNGHLNILELLECAQRGVNLPEK